jgi:hypothetical protein
MKVMKVMKVMEVMNAEREADAGMPLPRSLPNVSSCS